MSNLQRLASGAHASAEDPRLEAAWWDGSDSAGIEDIGLGGSFVDLDLELRDGEFAHVLVGGNDLDDAQGLSNLDASSVLEQAAATIGYQYRPRFTGAKRAELSFGPDDFEEGPERDAFVIIRQHKHRIFGSRTTPSSILKSIEWFFTAEDDGQTATFDLCCGALGVRADVLRLRLQYEFFLRWWVAPRPFEFLCSPVPDMIMADVAYSCPETGRTLASLVWRNPGIGTEALVAELGHEAQIKRDLTRLDEQCLICEQGTGTWYLTGRNPFLMRQRLILRGAKPSVVGGSVHWSRLF
jgi:hypothetical protein